MNDRARKIWRVHAELLFDEYKSRVQSSWILFPTGWKWKDKVYNDAIIEKQQKQFLSVITLLGEQLSDWTIPKMDATRLLKLMPIEDRATVKKMIENAYDDVGDCNGHIEAELDYNDAIKIIESTIS
jgi:hypothetical protein